MNTLPLLDARKLAEDDVARVLAWPDDKLALLMHQLTIAGWTRDYARSVLKKRGWWLG